MHVHNNFNVLLITLALQCLSPFYVILVNAQGNISEVAAGDIADFNQVVNVLGAMERTDQDFKDGLALDLFSPRNRTLVVRKNTAPLPPQFVTGTSGEPFVALSNYSYIIEMNETAKDLIAKVEIPYDPIQVKSMGVDPANTYVGKLAPDGLSWQISELQRNVHVSENNTRIIKMTELSGEYMLLGRTTLDTANIFVQYGFGATRTVNLTGGKGVQEAQFIDGLRVAIIADMSMGLNVDLRSGVESIKMPADMQSLNSYSWVMNTSMPNQSLKKGSVAFPINTNLIPTNTNLRSLKLAVGRRTLNGSSTSAFESLGDSNQMKTKFVTIGTERMLHVSGMTRLDGEYVILVSGYAKKESDFAEAQKETMGGMKMSAGVKMSGRAGAWFVTELFLVMAIFTFLF